MEPEKIKHISRLQEENARLRKLVVDLLMDKAMLEEALRGDCAAANLLSSRVESKN
jgi:hypothetical protein